MQEIKINGFYTHKDGGVYRALQVLIPGYNSVPMMSVIYTSDLFSPEDEIEVNKKYIRTVDHFNQSFTLLEFAPKEDQNEVKEAEESKESSSLDFIVDIKTIYEEFDVNQQEIMEIQNGMEELLNDHFSSGQRAVEINGLLLNLDKKRLKLKEESHLLETKALDTNHKVLEMKTRLNVLDHRNQHLSKIIGDNFIKLHGDQNEN